MLSYTLFHSIIWIKTCFLAYPFMNLATPWVFLWFVGVSSLQGCFTIYLCVVQKEKEEQWMQHMG